MGLPDLKGVTIQNASGPLKRIQNQVKSSYPPPDNCGCMKNAFGLRIPEIKEVLAEKTTRETVVSLFLPVLTFLDVPEERAQQLIECCLQAASNYTKLEDYEAQARGFLEAEHVAERLPKKFSARAEIIYGEVAPYLLDGSVLDYGCGDGRVAKLINTEKQREVWLTDVYEHRHVEEAGLNFRPFKQGAASPFQDEQFDNTLALTVFHHSNNPVESLRDVVRVTKTGGRVIVTESVYGVDGQELPKAAQSKIKRYLALTAEQQMKVNMYFDHFFNRVLNYSPNQQTKVNVPFNFNTPKNWQTIFRQNGLKQETLLHLGWDQPTAPEYHTLHVLRKTK